MRFASLVYTCLCLFASALLPAAAQSYGDVYVLVQYGAADDDDLAFGEGAQTASAQSTPPGAAVSASAYTAAPPPFAGGELGGSVEYDVAAGTPFAFAQSDRTGGAAEAFLSDVWLPILSGRTGERVSLTLRVHATGSGETRADPSLPGALGSDVLIEAGVFEAFGSGFAGALTAEAQLGYLVPPPSSGVPPGFVAPFFTGEWASGSDWTLTTDPAASHQSFSFESSLELPFEWPAGTAFEVNLFSQYFAGWCCRNVDQTLGASVHASLSHSLRYELEAQDPDLQLVRLPEPGQGLLLGLGLGLWMAVARSSPGPARASRAGGPGLSRTNRAERSRSRPSGSSSG